MSKHSALAAACKLFKNLTADAVSAADAAQQLQLPCLAKQQGILHKQTRHDHHQTVLVI